MAQVKYGSIITEIKGKLNGHIFQNARGNPIVRGWNPGKESRRGSPAGYRGDAGYTSRTNFSQVTKEWQKLSASERDSWAALKPTWLFYNKFGEPYEGSAFQIFTSANIARLSLGLSFLTEAPIADAAADPNLTFTDFSVSGDWEEEWTNGDAIGQYRWFQVTRPVSATTPYSKAVILASDSNPFVAPGVASRKAQYIAALGYTPPVGSKFFVYAWTTKEEYPRKQFITVYEINVVA